MFLTTFVVYDIKYLNLFMIPSYLLKLDVSHLIEIKNIWIASVKSRAPWFPLWLCFQSCERRGQTIMIVRGCTATPVFVTALCFLIISTPLKALEAYELGCQPAGLNFPSVVSLCLLPVTWMIWHWNRSCDKLGWFRCAGISSELYPMSSQRKWLLQRCLPLRFAGPNFFVKM